MAGEVGPGKISSSGSVCACSWVCIHTCEHQYHCFPTDLEGIYSMWGCICILLKIQTNTAFASSCIFLVQAWCEFFLLPAQRDAAVKQALLETSKPRSQCLVLEEALHGAISRFLVTGAWHCLERHLCKVCLWHATYTPTLVRLLNKQLSLNIKWCWWDCICCVRLLALGGLAATLGASWIALCNPSVVHALHASYRFTGHYV